jgi:hypothetical protein
MMRRLMMSELKPGFYAATLDGETRQGVLCDEGDFSFLVDGGFDCVGIRDVTDARPLIVLDLATDDRHGFVQRNPSILADFLRDAYPALADQIEAQTKPARIPEPGWDGKVLAHTDRNSRRREFVRFSKLSKLYTWSDGDSQLGSLPWEVLIEPALVREGVS